jgi:hypothetical protein
MYTPIVVLLSQFCSMIFAVISIVTVKHTVPLLFLAVIVYHHRCYTRTRVCLMRINAISYRTFNIAIEGLLTEGKAGTTCLGLGDGCALRSTFGSNWWSVLHDREVTGPYRTAFYIMQGKETQGLYITENKQLPYLKQGGLKHTELSFWLLFYVRVKTFLSYRGIT